MCGNYRDFKRAMGQRFTENVDIRRFDVSNSRYINIIRYQHNNTIILQKFEYGSYIGYKELKNITDPMVLMDEVIRFVNHQEETCKMHTV